ncbi:MAG: 50S ribosomal protein L5 [Gemmatimonadetes bacterium]|nr:50S ribosomal protein L5 [Gemmatimonadota bacterium]
MADAKEKEPKAEKAEAPKPKVEKTEKPRGKSKAEKVSAALPIDEDPNTGSFPKPRLREHYRGTVKAKLSRQFGFTNPHQVPRLLKIVLNVGAGAAAKNAKVLDAVVNELAAITGQKPMVNKAKKDISNFSLRAGVPIGASVTLRGARMWEFLDRFISVTVPRFRDFRGLPTRSFDGRGNYTMGIKEQLVFPEIDYDKVETIHGMDITFVTSAGRDDVGMALLREMGMPFRGETPVVV